MEARMRRAIVPLARTEHVYTARPIPPSQASSRR